MVIAGRDSDPDRARHYRIVAAAQLVETCAASRMPIRSPGRMPRLDSADRGSGVCTGASSARIGSRPLSQQAYHSLRQLPGLDGPAFVDRRSRRRACRAGRAGCILLATRDLDDAFDKLRAGSAEVIQKPTPGVRDCTSATGAVRDCAVRDCAVGDCAVRGAAGKPRPHPGSVVLTSANVWVSKCQRSRSHAMTGAAPTGRPCWLTARVG